MTQHGDDPTATSSARLRIGCAGWAIAAAHRRRFGAGDSSLARYATRFDAVEINSSFYRPHRPDTWRRWRDSVPADFRFSVKLPRTLTHNQRLATPGAGLDAFLAAAGLLGPTLGCLLVQLPPSLVLEPRVAARFFAALRRRWPGQIACEPRHPSWFVADAAALLARHRIARVGADPARAAGADVPAGDPACRYWRWHGSPEIYVSGYDDAAQRALAAAVASQAAPGDATWVIFDNTARGQATPDALALRTRLARLGHTR